MSAQALFAVGLSKARLKSSGGKAGKGSVSTASSTSSITLASSTKRSHAVAFATPVSAASIGTAISSVNVTTSVASILTTSSSKTLGAGSTGNASVFSPFWTPSVAALSQKLWWPTAIASHVSEWNFWSGCSSATTQGSWFSATLTNANRKPTNSGMTYSPSSLSSWLATTEGGPPQIASDGATQPAKKAKVKKNPEKPSAAKARKIRVYPSPRQKVWRISRFRKCLN